MTEKEKIETTIQDFKQPLEELDNELVMQTVGVARAMDEIRKNLEAMDEILDQRKYERVAQMGYQDISASFIWLQRELGGLQALQGKKETLVSEIAVAAGVPVFEKVAPFVDTFLVSAKVLTPEQKAKNRQQADEFFAKLKSEGKTILDYLEERRQSRKSE